jgi:amino acid transporter
MVAAVRNLPHGEAFATVLLIATAASLLKAWNGVFMMAVRLLVAMARAGCVPAVFARLHPRFQSPAPAVLVAGACNIGGIFLGKAAIEPITDMSAMVLTLTYGMCCWTVLRIRRRGLYAQSAGSDRSPGTVSNPTATAVASHAVVASRAMAAGSEAAAAPTAVFDVGVISSRKGAATWLIWLALAGSTSMAACAFLTPFWQQPGFPLEYQLLLAWGLMGYLVWRFALTQQSDPGSPNTRESS